MIRGAGSAPLFPTRMECLRRSPRRLWSRLLRGGERCRTAPSSAGQRRQSWRNQRSLQCIDRCGAAPASSAIKAAQPCRQADMRSELGHALLRRVGQNCPDIPRKRASIPLTPCLLDPCAQPGAGRIRRSHRAEITTVRGACSDGRPGHRVPDVRRIRSGIREACGSG